MFCQKYKDQISDAKSTIFEQNSLIDAINRSQAMIEFDIDGNILKANENFLQAMGYQAADLVGRHHRMFVSAEESNHPDYQKFWRTLKEGRFVSGRFKRLDKNGKEIWLEASYTPLFDEQGKAYKVVKVASDVTDKVQQEISNQGQIDAINRVMAVIEFDLDGNIINANDNLMSAMGYQLNEIQGKHHRLFVKPDYAESNEYRKFWQDLKAGQYKSGTFQRITRQGDDIWLEASYNPIFDNNDKPVRVIKYAVDVSKNENTLLLKNVIDDAGNVLKNFAEGDLTARMKQHLDDRQVSMFRPQIESLTSSIQDMSEKLQDVIVRAISSSQFVSDASDEVKQGALDLSERVQQQAAALEETSATMDQMNSAVQANTENAQNASKVSSEAQKKANEGTEVMSMTIDAMNAIEESSHKIAEIVTLIDGIAFQTNLLALNAAVEAARAGEHGRGFAVVAGEVRSLAQKSAEAAKDIKKLIDETSDRVKQGSTLASESGEMLGNINAAIESITQMVGHIAQASSEQATGISQVHQAISQIDEVTQQNAALVEETSAAAESMSDQANQLSHDMSFFRTGVEIEHAPRLPKKADAKPAAPVKAIAKQAPSASAPTNSDEWGEF
ncbi:methyl-accepting chemotaxis protein [Hydrogenovibrio sp. JE_KL2]|uniref:methyl-accepting chemotaxis protein n=1 Tax=Hydrogenovibrio sp. JE_KL2 TaxID=2651188 RepID=UPI00128B254A|nr:methyl-accepting chemotaxis protein [Hydrogenovibrio sp. JE_KL2]MPQ77292.1 PAS domain S-box protein [Hydrogenovibrio sp. JE_KL2]